MEKDTVRVSDASPDILSLDDLRRGGGPGTGKRGAKEWKDPKQPGTPKAATIRTALEYLFKATYAVPALAGYGDHWYLDDKELKVLGEQGEAAFAALPSAKVQALSKFISVWGPVLGLAATLVVITKARVDESRRLSASQPNPNAAGSPANPSPTGDGSANGNAARAAEASGRVAGRTAELFEAGQ